ncbi:cytochrome P450 [Deinococcus radiopugnans]|uniref:cytochrome P450 n=1 Tax=Deinococcus radiopugnans TaxID=57497 RepID=UPI0036223488
MGSRRLSRELDWNGVRLPRGTLALYAPYLSARDPGLWNAPEKFQPQRWQHKPPAWAYLPFGGGERLCLGMHLAQMLILDALAALPPCGPCAATTPPCRVSRWGRKGRWWCGGREGGAKRFSPPVRAAPVFHSSALPKGFA